MNASVPSREDLWRQYQVNVDLYKHYLKLVIEMNAFYYAIVGAIVAYFLAHKSEASMKLALALPVAMSFLIALFFTYASVLNKTSRQEMFDIRDALSLKVAPELDVLTWLLRISALLMTVVGLTLVGVLYGCLKIA
jgi:hypothetical protein